MAEDTAPLLGRPSGEDEETYKEAPSLARILGALSQGKLPDNGQLYALLHRAAAFLDGVSNAVDASTSEDDGEDNVVLSDDTAIVLATLMKENSALCRLLARWIYGEEAKGEDKQTASQGAHGNEKEQIQRLLWHLARAFSLDTPFPVNVDVNVPVDVEKAKDTIQAGAKQVQQDTRATGQSIVRLVGLILGSEE